MQCKFSPLCRSNATSNGYCCGHVKYGEPTPKKAYVIPKRSKKRIGEDVLLAKIKASKIEFLGNAKKLMTQPEPGELVVEELDF